MWRSLDRLTCGDADPILPTVAGCHEEHLNCFLMRCFPHRHEWRPDRWMRRWLTVDRREVFPAVNASGIRDPMSSLQLR